MPLNGYMIDVIVGPANPHVKHLEFEIKNAMKASVSPANSIQLHRNINMPDIMAMTDVAIVAGGSTCWELCFLGKPFIVLIAAENQHGIGHGLDDAGVAICLGWHEDVSLNQIKTSLKKLLFNTAIRRAQSAKGRKIVDGQGRYRVMDAICKSD
jgi:spore coat polysaccharide biosynthesis predicted glycosyltransferase SpsG